nr:MAG TPA: hypothetical protein [Caudoviricetes sp.]
MLKRLATFSDKLRENGTQLRLIQKDQMQNKTLNWMQSSRLLLISYSIKKSRDCSLLSDTPIKIYRCSVYLFSYFFQHGKSFILLMGGIYQIR